MFLGTHDPSKFTVKLDGRDVTGYADSDSGIPVVWLAGKTLHVRLLMTSPDVYRCIEKTPRKVTVKPGIFLDGKELTFIKDVEDVYIEGDIWTVVMPEVELVIIFKD